MAGDPQASTADSLRALRRGLQRSSGRFALFFAVCDRADTRKELIRLLGESMPGTKLTIATLDAETVDPLASVLDQVGEGQGPVMVVGLERAVTMGSDDLPILRVLNLERPEWTERLRRPVVFWVPEWLIGPLGREAPDFVDWRTDTLHFSGGRDALQNELAVFDDSLWRRQLDRRMSESHRQARMEELSSRLRLIAPSSDPVVERTRVSWLLELGDHLHFLGRLEGAQRLYRSSVAIAKKLGHLPSLAAAYHQLGRAAQGLGRYEEALDSYRKSQAISEELGDRDGLAISYHQLGNISVLRRSYQEALDWYRKSLAISEELGDRAHMAASYHQLGVVAQERGSFQEALDWYRKSLAIKEELGDRAGMASAYHQLGNVSFLQGSYEEALNWYRESLAIIEELGDRAGMAATYHQLGRLAQERAWYEEAVDWYRKSLAISEELGLIDGVARSSSQIGILLTKTGHPEEAVPLTLRSLSMHAKIGVPEVRVNLDWLRQQREALGQERFQELVEEHAESPEMAAAVLEGTAEAAGEAVQEVAEPAAVYETSSRPDQKD